MGSGEIFNYITALEVENEILRKKVQDGSRVDAGRFYGVILTTGEVARMHGVSRSRVAEYAKRGIIEKHPDSTDGRYLFRMSDALTWDFAKLKKDWTGERRGRRDV